eukprot:7705942-Prorocentrum_lima.AAC.1
MDLIHMAVDTCILETGDGGQDWQSKLHIPKAMGEEFVNTQEYKFKEAREHLRPDVAMVRQ